MDTYLEFTFKIKPVEPWSEILMAELVQLGFDSFTEEQDGILAYILKTNWDEKKITSLYLFDNKSVKIDYSYREMPNINWNEEWEKNFEPILVEDKVVIRAEFHPKYPDCHEIIIQPKMSFGTGHHPTTYLMIKQMQTIDFKDTTVLDMGCGTSVLAIFAKQKGAKRVLAIDIDEWAVENSVENSERNRVEIEVKRGTAENLGTESFDIILANINRNILISDIPKYVKVLNNKALLLLSGLCFFDVMDILQICEESRLTLLKKEEKEEWVSLLLEKV